MTSQALFNQAALLHEKGHLARAEELYRQILAATPRLFEVQIQFALLCFQQHRGVEALRAVEVALTLNPDAAEAHNLRGVLLNESGRGEEALANFTRALELKPDYADAWGNRGIALGELDRPEQALAAFRNALAIQSSAEGWNCHGTALRNLKRFEEALASYDKAVALAPDLAEAWNNRGLALQGLGRSAEALASVDRALALGAADPFVMTIAGYVQFQLGRVKEGFALLQRQAEKAAARPGAGRRLTDGPAHKQRHDGEQQAHLGARGIAAGFHLAEGERLDAAAVNPANAQSAEAQWFENRPPVVVIDNFLTDAALKKLRRYCRDSTIWQKPFKNSYLGALPEHGFACPLLAQIAEELRLTFPAVLGPHALHLLWGFKYDSRLGGIGVHADRAAVNVNFWITPDEANRNPQTGGMIIWDVCAPQDWEYTRYNGDEEKVRALLAARQARPMTVPYRANRAVIFDSDLFHETDRIEFREGYANRRISITLLYGRRTEQDF